jgi:hypothetical protein
MRWRIRRIVNGYAAQQLEFGDGEKLTYSPSANAKFTHPWLRKKVFDSFSVYELIQ